ncbi:MAG TPA: DUF305 domain-containing protein [Anaeromyxobacteraceae bacterium]|nr:DUF305 domain-containing protein [Anaeromyxobacteraceae bacterium]
MQGPLARAAVRAAAAALLVLAVGLASSRARAQRAQPAMPADPCWTAQAEAMHRMHQAMEAVTWTGDPDADFVRLMLPHHQAAVEMAKGHLLCAKDPQLRRLAQEIVTDQQSEIELMERWLARRQPPPLEKTP